MLLAGCLRIGYAAGTVTDAITGAPIAGATVRLYDHETRSAASGCFALGGDDGLPFELAVSAPGYRPVVVEFGAGYFEATVRLVPENRPGASTMSLDEIDSGQYATQAAGCG